MQSTPNLQRSKLEVALYLGMILVAAAVFGLVRFYGQRLTAPNAVEHATTLGTAKPAASHALMHLLLALVAVIVCGRLVGDLVKRVGQPPVIGEVMAGIMLGPSLLGWLSPPTYEYLLPQSVAPHLGMIAQLGVVLYMFCVGLELDGGHLRARGRAAVMISHASIVAPFILGAVLALALYPKLSTSDVPFTVFALFSGVAMSVTAFPVLARILGARGLTRTPLGAMALTCAAADDVTAWCLLAVVVGIAQTKLGGAFVVVGLAAAYIGFMLFVVRPAWSWLASKPVMSAPGPTRLAIVLVLVLLSALATELIGIHAIFGAFLLGAIIPHDSSIAKELAHKLEDVVSVLLLPAFFAYTGMRTQIGLVNGVENWLWCAAIIAVATAGKFGGSMVAARFSGMGWRESSGIGVLMNTRGLMELIVLNMGLDLGVISPRLFAMMVIMALVTTLMTSPLLALLAPDALMKQREALQPLAVD